jgi:hypothetical protein
VIDRTCIVGIDPGSKGAIAALWPALGQLGVWDIPSFEVIKSRRFQYVDGVKLGRLLQNLKPDDVWLERVHSLPKDGHVGAFTFGDNFGSVRTGAAVVTGKLPRMVESTVWKAAMRAPGGDIDSRPRAYELFPHCRGMFTREDKGEAAMIALYGALHLGHTPSQRITPFRTLWEID